MNVQAQVFSGVLSKVPPKYMGIATVLVVVLGTGGALAWFKLKQKYLGSGKNSAGYASLGIEPQKADVDKMMSTAQSIAKRRMKGAAWWTANFIGVHADGSVDLSQGGVASIKYISVPGVKIGKAGSIRQFTFNASQLNYDLTYKPKTAWTDVVPPPYPRCTVGQLLKKLEAEGLTGDKTVSIHYDPDFSNGQPNWIVNGEDPKINAQFSLTDCNRVK